MCIIMATMLLGEVDTTNSDDDLSCFVQLSLPEHVTQNYLDEQSP